MNFNTISALKTGIPICSNSLAILSLPTPQDFVVATGEVRSVEDFVRIAYLKANLDHNKYLVINKSLLKRKHYTLIGDSSLLRSKTGWSPSVNFEEMIGKLLLDYGVKTEGNI
jgi:GDPmannose 4,6-dehydratase